MKKVLALALSLALIATLAISGTVAYLQDTAEDVNVMTLGNVKIEQHEYERAEEGSHINSGAQEGDLVPFEQGKPLYPTVPKADDAYEAEQDANKGFYWGDYVTADGAWNGLWDDNKLANVMDKFVFVENTGKSDAYYRTLIALECPEGMEIGYAANGAEIEANVNGNNRFNWDYNVGNITIDDTRYEVWCVTYNEVLKPDEISRPSLLQVILTHHATNEDMELLGDTYEILVLSQAVQAAGFGDAKTALDTAFGKADATNVAEWFGDIEMPVAAADAAELSAALAAGKSVVLTEDVTVTSTITIPKNTSAKLDLAGNDLSYAVENDKAAAIITNNGTLEIAGTGTISFTAANPDLGEIPTYATNTITNEGTLVIGEGVTITNDSNGSASYAVDNKGKFTMNGGTLIGNRCALRIAKFNQDNVVFVMNGGMVKAATPAWVQLPGSSPSDAPTITVTINDGTFESTKTSHADNDVLYTYSFGNSHANTSLTINGGNFKGGTVSIGSGYKGDAPSLTINGGNFDYDVLQWLEGDTSKVVYTAN